MVLAVIWDLYGLGQALMEESGLMAVVVAGILVSSTSTATELRLLRRFKEQLTILAVSLVFVFVLLAADLSLASIAVLGWGSLWTVLTLMLLVRPLSVWLFLV
ncbi:MAG TPA: hypothetical protein IGS31_02525 [Oscillatoriales cyanobacterium M4454_W2019_049]|nr:hypothetical protein [Oscillatoriales cyanobacterium M4454_W2019_049]